MRAGVADPSASAVSVEGLPAADFFGFESMLNVAEQEKLAELREFLAREVAPFAGDWWNRAEFPAHILPKLAALELSAPSHRGYSNLFAGLVIAEITRVDTSLATFFLVHHDLFVESLHGFGSEEQKARLLDDGTLARIAAQHAATPAQIALAWVLRQENLIAIPKASVAAHVRQNHAALSIQLSPDDMAMLDRAFRPPVRKMPLEML